MSCDQKIYLHKGMAKALKCSKNKLTWAVQKGGNEFTLQGVKIKRIPHTVPGTRAKWGYIIVGPAEEVEPEEETRRHRAKPREGHCTGCEAKVGKYRAIRLNGNTVCQTCHGAAFINHDVDMRRTLGVV